MINKYRAEKCRFLNPDRRTTRVIYTPQVLFKDGWCSFPDHSTKSEIIEYTDESKALENAKELYEHFHAKGEC